MLDVTKSTEVILKRAKSLIEITPWSMEYTPQIARMLYELDQPCELAIAGQVKAGKSSFINALLGDDYAVVNVSEATATINVFRYGDPKDKEHPVKVIWKDGSEEWQTKAFLDSLQGNSDDVLNKAKDIDHLEYYLHHEILQNITLVDTPGTGSVVSEHNNRLAEYLAQQNIQRSNNLKKKADAVIVLVGHVQSRGDEDTVRLFTDGANPFNFLGVMSKIDDECSGKRDISLVEEYKYWKNRCTSYSERLRNRLHSIHPISVMLHRKVKQFSNDGTLAYIKTIIEKIPEQLFKKVIKSSSRFEEPLASSESELETYGFGLDFRNQLLQRFENFTVLKVVLVELYTNPVNTAISNLLDFAGMETLRKVLDLQFFSRSRSLRCYAALENVHHILTTIRDSRLPQLKRTAQYKRAIIDTINITPFNYFRNEDDNLAIKKIITGLIEREFWSEKEISLNRDIVKELLIDIENLQITLKGIHSKSEGLLLIDLHKDLFSDGELLELELLFGKNSKCVSFDSIDEINELKYRWDYKRQSTNNRDRRQIIDLAIDLYDRLIEDFENSHSPL